MYEVGSAVGLENTPFVSFSFTIELDSRVHTHTHEKKSFIGKKKSFIGILIQM